ncbi:MAG: response regulator [Candidatus Jacksonbacteria bacterium]|nr:response regulator [Candidatus Jacksonbacteria bacterium]
MGGNSLKILLVDDEKFILKMYQTKLEQAGYYVETASSGKDAVSRAKEDHPDLIFLDIVMGNMDGLEALKQLKKDPATKNVPVFMLTNIVSERDKKEALNLGAAGYCIKTDTEPADLLQVANRFAHHA